MTTAESANIPGGVRRTAFFSIIVKYVVGVLLCLTPVTAVIALGWLTRKTRNDILTRRKGLRPGPWPNIFFDENNSGAQWWARLFVGLKQNFIAGLKAWLAVLTLTLPFSLVWLAGWFAGWENSFSKGYELAGIWPSVSLLAVFLSLPILFLLPMMIAHQAVSETYASVFDISKIFRLIRAAGWRYLGLTVLIGLGYLGVFGARALPVFSEQMSVRVASGNPEAIQAYAGQFKLMATMLLFTGLIVVRFFMARIYAHAATRLDQGRLAGKVKMGTIVIPAIAMWLGGVFLIYVAQFLNYSWWTWLNQPVTMLPWLGILVSP